MSDDATFRTIVNRYPNTPRELAEKIIGGEDAWVDTDAEIVARAYLELLDVREEDAYRAKESE